MRPVGYPPAMWIALLLSLTAVAQPALPVAAVLARYTPEGQPLRQPSFGTADTGWSINAPGQVVFVYAAPDEAALRAWAELQLSRQRTPAEAVPTPAEGILAAWRRGTDFALVLSEGVGIMVQGGAEAGEEASVLRSLIDQDPGPWPAAPRLVQGADGLWTIEAPGALHLAWRGGQRVSGQGARFTAPPAEVWAWDAWGRVSRWEAGNRP